MRAPVAFAALTVVVSLTVPGISCAAINPAGTKYDSRVKTVFYNPDDVVRVKVRQGTSTLIQLEDDETLEAANGGMGIGDSEAWTIGVRGNNIFMKPKAASPDTNITLVTNKRTYAFALESVKNDSNAAYIVRFNYPEKPEPKPNPAANRQPCTDLPDPTAVNVSYQAWGDGALTPTAMWDDGRFTCMKYPRTNDLPAIYRIAGDGSETLTNYNVEGNIVVVHSVAKEFRLRLGEQVLGIRTDGLKKANFNRRNTTVPGEYREVTGDE
ncbi:TrbG/VirB9 family P-type conjugative transfer protein [Kushneria indalinina]|uniref:Type IV secretion system protein VirB9 n=1 Tax=Kushneria indalinina DSM 14324 TaxID=1122140 RepID=A0A3D9DRG9_9GAMM|nr:TrbG/VirB9 family P-type conjugative transfer protein [Kushneria indalinina]REC93328.1 type IV secretion system protein VirB9 [Kushneria indalinina DSM 14324]